MLAGDVSRATLLVPTFVVCGILAARSVTTLVDAWLPIDVPAARPGERAVLPTSPARDPDDAGAAMVARNIFCSTCDGRVTLATAGAPVVELLATDLASPPVATLWAPLVHRAGAWGLGEHVPGVGRIARIGFTSVDIFDDHGRLYTLSLRTGTAAGSHSAATEEPAAGRYAGRIVRVDERTFEIERALIRELVQGQGMKEVRIVPSMHPGGVKLYAIRPGGWADALGLKNGDRLRAVDGAEIASADKLLDLYVKLDTADEVTLEGTRGDQPLVRVLRLR